MAKNPVCQATDFCIEKALKLTYEHLELKKFSGGFAPWTPRKQGMGKRVGLGEETEKGRKGAGGGNEGFFKGGVRDVGGGG
jgi:hypothetical protein